MSDSRVSVAGAEYPLTPFVIECDLRDSAALAILSLDFLGELLVERYGSSSALLACWPFLGEAYREEQELEPRSLLSRLRPVTGRLAVRNGVGCGVPYTSSCKWCTFKCVQKVEAKSFLSILFCLGSGYVPTDT